MRVGDVLVMAPDLAIWADQTESWLASSDRRRFSSVSRTYFDLRSSSTPMTWVLSSAHTLGSRLGALRHC